MIYFMRIWNTGVLLVSSGKILCDLIRACSNDSHEYARIRCTHEFHNSQYLSSIRLLILRLRKLCDFVLLSKILFLLNNIYANQIPGQSTCVKSFIFASSYLCALTTTRIIRINNITA